MDVTSSTLRTIGLTRVDPRGFQDLRKRRGDKLGEIRDAEEKIKILDIDITKAQSENQDILGEKPRKFSQSAIDELKKRGGR